MGSVRVAKFLASALIAMLVLAAPSVSAKKVRKVSHARIALAQVLKDPAGSLFASVKLFHTHPRCKRFTNESTAEIQINFTTSGVDRPSTNRLRLTEISRGRFVREFAASESYPSYAALGYAGMRPVSDAESPAYLYIHPGSGTLSWRKGKRTFVLKCRAPAGGVLVNASF